MQTTGTSETDVMSQKAVTKELNENKTEYRKIEFNPLKVPVNDLNVLGILTRGGNIELSPTRYHDIYPAISGQILSVNSSNVGLANGTYNVWLAIAYLDINKSTILGIGVTDLELGATMVNYELIVPSNTDIAYISVSKKRNHIYNNS